MQAKHISAKQAEKEAVKEPFQIEEEWGFEQVIIGPVGSLGFMQLSNNDRVIAAPEIWWSERRYRRCRDLFLRYVRI